MPHLVEVSARNDHVALAIRKVVTVKLHPNGLSLRGGAEVCAGDEVVWC